MLVIFLFQNFKYFTPIFLLTSFLREVQYNSYSYFFIGKIPPPPGIFQDFLFAFEFLQFYYAVHRYEFFGIYPAWYSLCFPNLWFSLCHSFWKILCHYYFKYFFLFLFSSASGFPLHVCYTFSNFPRVLGYSVSFFIPFSLYMSVWKFLLTSSGSLIVPLTIYSLLMSLSKEVFITFTGFSSLALIFYSFLEFPSPFLHFPSVFACCLLITLESSTR